MTLITGHHFHQTLASRSECWWCAPSVVMPIARCITRLSPTCSHGSAVFHSISLASFQLQLRVDDWTLLYDTINAMKVVFVSESNLVYEAFWQVNRMQGTSVMTYPLTCYKTKSWHPISSNSQCHSAVERTTSHHHHQYLQQTLWNQAKLVYLQSCSCGRQSVPWKRWFWWGRPLLNVHEELLHQTNGPVWHNNKGNNIFL